eukprot:Hpha_TRINITY_DN15077_c0_g2::TRINITY_DN15077_c0_g2_i1::g.123988::m.123988
MIEGIMLGVIAVIAAVMYFTFTQMFGKKPNPVDLDFAGSGSPSKKKPKKKPVKSAPVTEKWDAPEPADKKGKKKKETDAFFDPVKQGETIVKSAQRAALEDKAAATNQQLSQRQRNKLQAQGFVIEDKKPRRTSSRDKVEVEETVGKHDDLSPEAAERMLLLERIASGQRAIDIDGGAPRGDRRGPRKAEGDADKAAADSKARIDTETLRKRLDEAKAEKKQKEQERTAVRGGRVAYVGTSAKKSTANAWSRGGGGSPKGADAADEPQPAMDEAAPADEPEA